MKRKGTKTVAVMILSGALMLPGAPYLAIAQESPSASMQAAGYYLPNSVRAVVKSVLNEKTAEGTRIGAVVKLYNEGTRVTRVPDLELKAKTTDGVSYTLSPSASNPRSIQPRTSVEVSYMMAVDREDEFSLEELSWVEVDEYVYPKKETYIQSVPVGGMEWRGEGTVWNKPSASVKWGDSFSLPDLTTALEFKADGLDEQITPQGNTTVVRMLVTNKSKEKRSVPDFRLNALSDKAYTGQRLEQGNVTLEPGEQRYVHFSFPIENRLDLHSLMVLTPETFTADDKTTVTYYVGRLAVTLPEDSNAQPFIRKPVAYDWNSRIPFDSLNRLIHPKLEVTLADLHLNESEGGGFKSGIAKFKLINRSDRPLPLPNFQTQWVSADGSKYAGTRQSTKVDSLMPNVGYVLYYSFVLPASEKGDRVGMELLDGVTAAPYKATIASLQTGIKPSVKGLDFYPFQVKLNDWTVTPEQAQPQATTFTYKVNLDLSVTRQDEVVVDQTFTRMKVELLDSQGNTLGAKLLPLTGEGRVESGVQTIDIRSIRSVRDFSLRVYETVETPFGEAERLLGTFAP